MKKVALLHSLAAWLILAAALVLFPGPAQAVNVITDFSNWTDVGPNTGLFSRPAGGGLSFNDATGGKTDNLVAPGPVPLPGPFFRALQFSNFQASNSNTAFTWSASSLNYVMSWGPTSYSLFVYEAMYNSTGNFFGAGLKNNSTGQKTQLGDIYYTTADSGWLGIGYNGVTGPGGQFTFWYSTGSGWTQIGSYATNTSVSPTPVISGLDGGQQLSFQVEQIQVFTGTESPVPLPPSVFMLGSGLLGLAGLRRRFKRS